MDQHFTDIDLQIVKFLAGESSPEEAMRLYDWMDQAEVNKRYFEAAEAAWMVRQSTYKKPDTKKAYESLGIPGHRGIVLFTPFRIAATVMLLIGVGAILYVSFRTVPEIKPWITKSSMQQPATFQLPEKTTITLNGNSRIRYPEAFETKRQIELTGEAYFDVTPDQQKPFIVAANAIEVKVLGTAFNVSAYDADTVVRVEVVHGRVLMKHLTDSLILEAKQKGVYHKVSQKLWLEHTETHNSIGYATHTFTYSDNSLGQVLDDLTTAYGVTFEVENARVRNCRLTGEYHSMQLSVILEIISKSLDLTYSISGNRVYISGDGCL